MGLYIVQDVHCTRFVADSHPEWSRSLTEMAPNRCF